ISKAPPEVLASDSPRVLPATELCAPEEGRPTTGAQRLPGRLLRRIPFARGSAPMSNYALWNVRKRHEWLSKPQKAKRLSRRKRARIGLQEALDRKAPPAPAGA